MISSVRFRITYDSVKHLRNSSIRTNTFISDSDNSWLFFSEKSSQNCGLEKSPENVFAFPEGIGLIPPLQLYFINIEAGFKQQFLPGPADAGSDVNARPFSGRLFFECRFKEHLSFGLFAASGACFCKASTKGWASFRRRRNGEWERSGGVSLSVCPENSARTQALQKGRFFSFFSSKEKNKTSFESYNNPYKSR